MRPPSRVVTQLATPPPLCGLEVVAVGGVGGNALEVGQLFLRYEVFAVYLVVKNVGEAARERYFLGECVGGWHVSFIAEYAHQEHALAVLRHAVVLGVQHLPEVGVAVILQFRAPFEEIGEELLADKGLDVLQQQEPWPFGDYGLAALPQ